MNAKGNIRAIMDRRTFLKRSGALGIGLALGGFGGLIPVSESVAFNRRLYKVTRVRLAMGTFVAITAMHPSRTEADEVIGRAFEEMDRVSGLLNRYESDSAIGTLNRDGYLHDLPREMSAVIARSLHFHGKSRGAFDITVKPLVDLYKAHFEKQGAPPSEKEVSNVLNLVDSGAIRLGHDSVRFEREGMGITLDGIAKGYIIDRAAQVVAGRGIKHALINAGGDIRALGGKDAESPWKVAIKDPGGKAAYADTITMKNRAIATSGNYEVYFDREKLYHHIVNPKTGRSPRRSASVTVLASNVMDADALSTAVFVLGPDDGRGFIEGTPGVECLIVSSKHEKIISSGWPSS
jgi:thiamine biosynthesis lipoprotein